MPKTTQSKASTPFDIFTVIAASQNKDNQKITSTDPLAMACHYYNEGQEYGNLGSDEYYVSDKTLADNIRQYYRNAYTIQALKGNKLSKYQRDVMAIVTGQRAPVTGDTGLLHRLPYLHNEDVIVDQVVEQTENIDTPATAEISRYFNLNPIAQYKRYRGSMKGIDFWFKTEHNKAVRLFVHENNMLLTIMSQLFQEGPRDYLVTLGPALHVSPRKFSYYTVNTIALG